MCPFWTKSPIRRSRRSATPCSRASSPAASSYSGESSTLVARSAPATSSSTSSAPMPPPTSRRVPPRMPCSRTTDAIRLDSRSSRLGDPCLERLRQRLADRLELHPREDVLEETADDQPLGFGARETARHQVEELLTVDTADGRTMRATDVVRHDLEARDRHRVRRR